MTSPKPVLLGTYRGLTMELYYDIFHKEFAIDLKGKGTYPVSLGTDKQGNLIRLDNEIGRIEERLSWHREHLKTLEGQLENARTEVRKEFPQEKELAEKIARLGELNALLDMDKKENIVLDSEMEEEEREPEKKRNGMER